MKLNALSKKLITSEAVTKGHPDKICDQVSDAILDAYLMQDNQSRVACEVAIHHKGLLIMGEITSNAVVDIEDVARKTICNIGYNSDQFGFKGNTCEIIIRVHQQSSDIALGMKKELGAGDQGMMFGYATNEHESLLPISLVYAQALVKRLDEVRESKIVNGLGPDGKSQVTVEFHGNIPIRIDSIVISCQHLDSFLLETLQNEIIQKVIIPTIPKNLIDSDTKIFINPTGRFVIGGPVGDSGLTGRKIIVDTYGGIAHHGGGAFSGKDYTKIDRSASYYARYVAKHIVASNLADKCEVQVSYVIGVVEPTSVQINTFGTNHIPEEQILSIVNKLFSFKPIDIVTELNLPNVHYLDTTVYGHFGKAHLPWERLNKLDKIEEMVNDVI